VKHLVRARAHGEGYFDIAAEKEVEIFDRPARDLGHEVVSGKLATPELCNRSSHYVVDTAGACRGQREDIDTVSGCTSGGRQDRKKDG
jgi:hypothetical protein